MINLNKKSLLFFNVIFTFAHVHFKKNYEMKFRKTILSLAFSTLLVPVFAQTDQILKSIENSKLYLKEKNYTAATGSLQEAINRINDIIGGQILASLPKTTKGFSSDVAGDQVTSLGTMMGAGMVISRNYLNDDGKSVSMQITPNSPSLESLNTFLENPTDYGSESDAGKSIKVGKYKALCRFVKEEEGASAYLQMPFYSSVIVFQGNGFKSEEEFTAVVESFNFDGLAKSMGFVKEENK